MQEALAKDEGFTEEGRKQVLEAVREKFADYGLKVVRPDRADVGVTLRMIAEGAMDNVSPERIAEVAFAAFVAVTRGAQPEVVEGIGLYGYRKQIAGDRIATWANGYNDLAKAGVPSDVSADLVRNAMEHDWDDKTFNTFKWSLVTGTQRKFDIRRYAAFEFLRMEEGKEGPGAITLAAARTFAKAQRDGSEVPIPDYRGVFSITKEPPAPPPAPIADEGKQAEAKPEEAPAQAADPAAVEAYARADQKATASEAAATQAGEKARQERQEAEKAAQEASLARAKAEAAEKEAAAQQSAAEQAAQETAAQKAAEDRKAAKAARRQALADQKAAEKLRKKAEADQKAAARATKRAAKARSAADRAKGAAASVPESAAEARADEGGPKASTAPRDEKMSALWPKLDAAARAYIGTPYVWGGETKKGIDCSGFTKQSYQEGAQIGIPRNSRQQWKTGARVDYDKLQEGDLVFFDTMGHGVSHVGMVVDPKSNHFIHASSSRGVIEDDLGKQWFKKRYLGARRVVR